ncbi:MAG: hypothetical protein WC809_19265, partial [Sinimarinibacterium sp.]
ALDVQQRTPEHGARRHHAHSETGHGRIAPLLAAAKNGGITQELEDGQPLEKLRSQRLLDIASWGFEL